jgi:hypothetical protein
MVLKCWKTDFAPSGNAARPRITSNRRAPLNKRLLFHIPCIDSMQELQVNIRIALGHGIPRLPRNLPRATRWQRWVAGGDEPGRGCPSGSAKAMGVSQVGKTLKAD